MKNLIKVSSLLSLLCIIIAFSVVACNKDENLNTSGNTENEFQGDVIIVGAGASGLAAAKKMEEYGISYQILEATDRACGRIQKNEDFADFPIDIGAEWIHEDKSILNYLINQPENTPNVETILYQPMNIFQESGGDIWQIPIDEMQDFYALYIKEYKFKNTTWYDFIYQNFAQSVQQNIIYNSKVIAIDYSKDKVVLTTENGTEYQADKVILTVSLGVLKSNAITFTPPLNEDKISAIDQVEFLPGFKLFMKFSDQFYPDGISCETSIGEKTYYDVTYGKESEDHVLGLLSTGISAQEYYELGSPDAILTSVLQELDTYYNGLASQYYLNSYIYKDWGRHIYTLGTWTSDMEASANVLSASLNDKVYFAGETHNEFEEIPTEGFFIIRGSVQSAILSGYDAVEQLLE